MWTKEIYFLSPLIFFIILKLQKDDIQDESVKQNQTQTSFPPRYYTNILEMFLEINLNCHLLNIYYIN